MSKLIRCMIFLISVSVGDAYTASLTLHSEDQIVTHHFENTRGISKNSSFIFYNPNSFPVTVKLVESISTPFGAFSEGFAVAESERLEDSIIVTIEANDIYTYNVPLAVIGEVGFGDSSNSELCGDLGLYKIVSSLVEGGFPSLFNDGFTNCNRLLRTVTVYWRGPFVRSYGKFTRAVAPLTGRVTFHHDLFDDQLGLGADRW